MYSQPFLTHQSRSNPCEIPPDCLDLIGALTLRLFPRCVIKTTSGNFLSRLERLPHLRRKIASVHQTSTTPGSRALFGTADSASFDSNHFARQSFGPNFGPIRSRVGASP
jgi:hypothetical protein